MIAAIQNTDVGILAFIQNNFRCGFLDAIIPFISSLMDKGMLTIALSAVFIFAYPVGKLCIFAFRKPFFAKKEVYFKETTESYLKSLLITGLMMALAMTIGLIIVNGMIKPAVNRIRPYNLGGALVTADTLLIRPLKDGSFPSGHTLAAFEAATVLMIRDKKFGIPMLIFAFVVLFTRLYLYVHFPSDVIVGAVLGVVFGVLGVVIVNAIVKKIKKKKALD